MIVTAKGCEPLAGGCALSVALTVNANAPTEVGVPESVPSEASVSPAGKAPELIAQVNGGEPPLALNEKPAYGLVATPAGGAGDALTTTGEAGRIGGPESLPSPPHAASAVNRSPADPSQADRPSDDVIASSACWPNGAVGAQFPSSCVRAPQARIGNHNIHRARADSPTAGL